MDGRQLIYFTDPMCSWCYGFSPVIDEVAARYADRLPIRLVMGGLRPGNTKPMTREAAQDLRGHWTHVTEASGQDFGACAIDAGGFVYDTDPAARAVALARRTGTALALDYLREAHKAFYVRGLDITNPEVLADLAAELGMDRTAFRAGLDDPALKEEAWSDYSTSQNAGVSGFPTLILGPNPDGTYSMVTRGFNSLENILETIERRLAA